MSFTQLFKSEQITIWTFRCCHVPLLGFMQMLTSMTYPPSFAFALYLDLLTKVPDLLSAIVFIPPPLFWSLISQRVPYSRKGCCKSSHQTWTGMDLNHRPANRISPSAALTCWATNPNWITLDSRHQLPFSIKGFHADSSIFIVGQDYIIIYVHSIWFHQGAIFSKVLHMTWLSNSSPSRIRTYYPSIKWRVL